MEAAPIPNTQPIPKTQWMPPPPAPRPAEAPRAVPASRVGVEIVQRDHGVQVMRYVDTQTGLVIYQNPPEQVLALVANVIETIRQREQPDGR